LKIRMAKTKIFFFFIFLFFFRSLLYHFISQVRGEEYFFENVNVLIVGRCRTIRSDGSWLGGLYKGPMHLFGVTAWHTPLERLQIVVYNETILDPWMTFSRLRNSTGGDSVNGTFYWGGEENGVSLIPPIIFVHCFAERFQVNV
jgi:hypothetical protein